MLDQRDRLVDYLRISVTDRCNLRCVYCMPAQGIAQTEHNQMLSYEELLRLARLFASLGIRRIRLTGGEPLVRKDLPALVAGLKHTPGIHAVYLTTNGVLLGQQLPALLAAGLDGVNISLDTLDRRQYAELTRRDELDEALRGLHAALAAPGLRVKVNCVATSRNCEQWAGLAALARDHAGLDVRFIELMPLGLGRSLPGECEGAVLSALEGAFGPSLLLGRESGAGPASYVGFACFDGRVGFISAMSQPFCAQCNRIRLTADGQLKPCLYYSGGIDLKGLLRGGAGDDDLRNVMAKAIRTKPDRHQFGNSAGPVGESRCMNQIGG